MKNNNSILYKHFILHLSLIEGVGPAAVQQIMHYLRSGAQASDLYLFSSADWMNYCRIRQTTAEKIVAGLSDKKLLEIELSLIERHGINWATAEDDEYPLLLASIHMPPPVLYWQGNYVFNNEKKHCAVVGARAANGYGHNAAKNIVTSLVASGCVIVSGGALGVDTTAHITAVQSGGLTIAVLGSGLLRPYPLSNKKLFASIVENGGVVVSAFPLLMEPLPGNFPARNRIISGLSHGCLVVQAAAKSGALITARYALEQGRDVFAIPGRYDDLLSAGCHALIKDGAKLVDNAADILQEFGISQAPARDIQKTIFDAEQLIKKERDRSQKAVAHVADQLLNAAAYSDNQKTIINACKNRVSLDDIMYITGLDSAVVQAELFNLQLDGKVEQDFAGMWITQ